MFPLLKKPHYCVDHISSWFLVGCKLRKAVLELELSLEGLVFLLPAAEMSASSVVIRDVLVDQTEEFLASQIKLRLL